MTIEQYKSLELLDKYFKETPKEEVEAEINLISNLDIRSFALSIYGVGVRSEQLKAFNKQMEMDYLWYHAVSDSDIDEYCKSL